MSDIEWQEWVDYHSTLFRMTADEDVAMMQLWRESFEGRAFTLDELRHASKQLATSDAKRWRSEHLEAILRSITVNRLARSQALQDEQDRENAYPCSLCGNSGIVAVPHPDFIRAAEQAWTYYTAAVSCRCYRGQRVSQSNLDAIELSKEDVKKRKRSKPYPRMMTLDDYERRNPDWYGQLKRQEQSVKREQAARAATRKADTQRGPLAAVIDGVIRKLT